MARWWFGCGMPDAAACLLTLLVPLLGAGPAGAAERAGSRARPPEAPEAAGFSFRVEFQRDAAVLKRTSYELPRRGERVIAAYLGASLPVLRVGLGEGARLSGVDRSAGDCQTAAYATAAGGARVVVSRLTPAVLVDSAERAVELAEARPGCGLSLLAWPEADGVRAAPAERLPERLQLSEPWMLAWFGRRTPYRGYVAPMDLDDPHDGAGFARMAHPPQPLDMPLLLRLEHRPARVMGGVASVRFEFDRSAGKLAVMPLFGGRIVSLEESSGWVGGPPRWVVAQCRRWASLLRDVPVAVRESWVVHPEAGVVEIANQFQWASLQDDWRTSAVRAAPLPPMLALALAGGGRPVRFLVDGRAATPEDDQLMDTPGLAMSLRGADQYVMRIEGLRRLADVAEPGGRADAAPAELRDKLERHVRTMVDAGPLAPLLFIHGGIGGARPAYFYWGRTSELAQALAAALPWLSDELQADARRYLNDHWRRRPPLSVDPRDYREGANRAPYEIPWEDIGRDLQPALNRQRSILSAGLFGELYGVDAYLRATGSEIDPSALRRRVEPLWRELLGRRDWALLAPVRPHDARIEFLTGGAWYERNGQAALNSWLAGAIGLVRLADRFRWREEQEAGWLLLATMAMARVGQARYVAEMHRRGLVRGDARDDWRTLVHIDPRCAIVLRGNIKPVVLEDQELPPFIDLVEEVGRLLRSGAREECRIYLDHLDRSMPLWYVSEAPKQSASEQRLCPLLHKSGNVLAQYWVLGKRGEAFRRYVDTTRFVGDLYYVQNMAALMKSYGEP